MDLDDLVTTVEFTDPVTMELDEPKKAAFKVRSEAG